MHELAVAQNIVEAAAEEAQKRGGRKIVALTLRLGRFSCVQQEPIAFCFELVAKGSIAEGARLLFEDVEPEGECEACGARFAVETPLFRCPACGGGRTKLTKGTECQLVELEVPE